MKRQEQKNKGGGRIRKSRIKSKYFKKKSMKREKFT
jgi:hypothetical protein